MAVKMTRQPDKIALLGAPTSAAGLWPGNERAPAALRAAGLSDQLRAAELKSSITAMIPFNFPSPMKKARAPEIFRAW